MEKSDLLTMLTKHAIKYDVCEHPPLHTVLESKKFRGKIEGAHTKNLFLKNKKNNFFLFSCQESTIVNLKQLNKVLNLGNISFARDLYLEDMLGKQARFNKFFQNTQKLLLKEQIWFRDI